MLDDIQMNGARVRPGNNHNSQGSEQVKTHEGSHLRILENEHVDFVVHPQKFDKVLHRNLTGQDFTNLVKSLLCVLHSSCKFHEDIFVHI